MENFYQKVTDSLRNYFKKHAFSKVVVGVSGGVDSAVCLKLAVDALGPQVVTAVLMPEKGLSSEENLHHAKMLCQYLKVENFTVPINTFTTDYLMLPWKGNDSSKMNTKARIRMTILYNYANSHRALVIGTSNKSELMIGYGTKFGDLAGDIELIGDLYKEEVYQLAAHLNLPHEFIDKAPSAELYSGQTDEEEFGFSYKELDHILKKIALGDTKEAIINKGMNPNTVHKVFRLIETNRHKTEPTPVIKQ